jgi:hypothetical protein
MRFDLSDEEWSAIEPLLPAAKHGPARVDDRRVLNGISISCAQAHCGGICRSVTAQGRRCIIGIIVGRSAEFGREYSMPWPRTVMTR